MASARLDTCEVISDVRSCRRAVSELLQQRLVAVDAEGVNLGKIGPMTLIQVALETGHVYLFDVYRHGRPTPEMFSEGGLKELLESENVLKVMHAGSNDGTALKFQYDVTLKNVYDIQVAQHALDEAEGRQLPPRRNLLEVCRLYLSDISDLDDKKDVKAKWHLEDAEFWTRRPFTKEMIDYASADVRLLIPDVYNKQRRLLREKGLEAAVQTRVQEEIQARWDETLRESVQAKQKEKFFSVIRQIERQYPQVVDLARLQDEDELSAIARLRDDELDNFSPVISDLKLQHYRKQLAEIRESLRDGGAGFFAHRRDYYFLFRLKSHKNASLQKESTELLRTIERLEVQHMARKYRLDTPLKHVSDQDKKTLRFLRPGKEEYHRIVTRLHWLVKEEDVEYSMERLRSDKEAYRQSYKPGHENFLKFLISADIVPPSLRDKAKQLMRMLEEAGLVQRRQASRGNCPRRH